MRFYINRISLNAEVTFKVYDVGLKNERFFMTKGRKAQALMCLAEVGAKGITSEEVASWALRLASYIFDLKRLYGLDIQTTLEPHEGGRHARYTLFSLVEVVAIDEPK
jgi:hypothetical protein